MSHRTAIIRNAGIGMRDGSSEPCMWFDAYVEECVTSPQVLSWNEAGIAFRDADVHDVREFNGKPCVVDHDDDLKISRYVRMWGPL